MARRPRKPPVFTPQLRAWIDAHVALGEFDDAGSCVEDAFRRLQEIESTETLTEAIDAARKSGPGREYSKNDWKKLKEDARRFVETYHRALADPRCA